MLSCFHIYRYSNICSFPGFTVLCELLWEKATSVKMFDVTHFNVYSLPCKYSSIHISFLFYDIVCFKSVCLVDKTRVYLQRAIVFRVVYCVCVYFLTLLGFHHFTGILSWPTTPLLCCSAKPETGYTGINYFYLI